MVLVGISSWLRQRREQREAEIARVHARAADERRSRALAELGEMIALASTNGWAADRIADLTLILDHDERWLGSLRGVSLIQPRVGPSHTVTNYAGFSYRLTEKTRVRSGQYRSTHVPGVEEPTDVDAGLVVITSKRVVFQGNKRSHEWPYTRMLGYLHSPTSPWTSIQIRGRERVSGIRYDWQHASWFRFRLAWGLALFHEETRGFVASLRAEQRELDADVSPDVEEQGVLPATTGDPSADSSPDPATQSVKDLEELGGAIEARLQGGRANENEEAG